MIAMVVLMVIDHDNDRDENLHVTRHPFPLVLQSDTLLDLLGGGEIINSQPEPQAAPAVKPPASSGGELLDLLGGLDLGPTPG